MKPQVTKKQIHFRTMHVFQNKKIFIINIYFFEKIIPFLIWTLFYLLGEVMLMSVHQMGLFKIKFDYKTYHGSRQLGMGYDIPFFSKSSMRITYYKTDSYNYFIFLINIEIINNHFKDTLKSNHFKIIKKSL